MQSMQVTTMEHQKIIQQHLDQGEDVILEIEIQGALKIKEQLPETIFIFIMPPSMQELKRRLQNRKTEDAAKIDKRFKRAYEKSMRLVNITMLWSMTLLKPQLLK